MSYRAILLAQAAMMSWAIAQPAMAQQSSGTGAILPEAEDGVGDGSAIVVTGVRGRTGRTVADSPVPIDVIGADQLKASGRIGLKEVLGTLIPSFTQAAQSGGGTSASVRPVSIRGLSGDYLLVLVNGKRRHTTSLINTLASVAAGSSPVDIDLLPTNAIGRLEVLRDGAAAQYGSDAISGVINIILDNQPHGASFDTTAGLNYEGDGALLQQAITVGTPLGQDGGFLRLAVEGRYREPANRTEPLSPNANFYPTLNGQSGGPRDPREATANRNLAQAYGRSNRDMILNTSYNSELPVGSDTTLYSFGTYSYRNIKDARGSFTANNVASLPQIYPDGFQAYRRISEHDFQFAAGVRGDAGAWHWDASSSYGRDKVRLGGENTLNPSIGPASKTSFFMGYQISDLWVNNLDIGTQWDAGLARPVSLSFGVEHRWERFRNKPGEPDSYRLGDYVVPRDNSPFGLTFGGQRPPAGLVSFTGTSIEDARSLSRNNVAAYIDVGADITNHWFVGLASRAEHYDDSAGNTVSGKFSTRLDLGRGLALRGGINTGFRAPSLGQRGFSTTQNSGRTNFQGVVEQFQSKFLPVDSPQAILLGAKLLKPEKSLNFTAGITFEPHRDLRFTIDAYQIDIDERIAKTELIRGPAVAGIFATQGITNLDSAQYFANAIDTRTQGVDVVAEYQLRTGSAGVFKLNAAYSYNRSTIRSVISNPRELDALGPDYILFGRQAQQYMVAGTPRDKLAIGLDWTLSKVHSVARITRYGSYVEPNANPVFDQHFGSKWIVDLDVSYALSDRIKVSAGATNLLDTYPDANGLINPLGWGKYGYTAPFGLTGGSYYTRLGITF